MRLVLCRATCSSHGAPYNFNIIFRLNQFNEQRKRWKGKRTKKSVTSKSETLVVSNNGCIFHRKDFTSPIVLCDYTALGTVLQNYF